MTVSDRISGYIDALKEKRALVNPSHILTDFSIDYSKIDKKHPLYGYLKGDIVSAFITLNARLALYLKHMANEIGLQVPEDVSILTFDDPSLSFGDFEKYTHINQWEKDMGRQSAEILMNVMDHPEKLKKDYQKVVLQPKLIVGHSTAPAKTSINRIGEK
jgi:GntR family transcriptional regulator of arabinose operon